LQDTGIQQMELKVCPESLGTWGHLWCPESNKWNWKPAHYLLTFSTLFSTLESNKWNWKCKCIVAVKPRIWLKESNKWNWKSHKLFWWKRETFNEKNPTNGIESAPAGASVRVLVVGESNKWNWKPSRSLFWSTSQPADPRIQQMELKVRYTGR